MTGQLKVLVLDASATSRKILEVILVREGHQVACFGNAPEALRFLSQYGPADLLFLALELPGMDGLDVLKYLRDRPQFHSMIPIALLNKHDGVLLRLKARLAGAQQVVRKPLVGRQVAALVSAYLYALGNRGCYRLRKAAGRRPGVRVSVPGSGDFPASSRSAHRHLHPASR